MSDEWMDEMTDRFRHRLSEYLDGDLSADERVLVELHVESCGDCARTLAELEQVVAHAGQLAPRLPARDLWPEIAARLDEAPAADAVPLVRRRLTFSIPQLAAAAVTLASLSAGTAWLAGSRSGDAAGPGTTAAVATDPVVRAASSGGGMAAYYAAAIAELERLLFEGERPLPPESEVRIRRALVTIDRAIEDARRALDELPDDPYLQQHVASTMERKAEFLRRAVRMTAES